MGYTLPEAEERFAEIVWANAPVVSPELVRLAEVQLNWAKSTTYTVLRKLVKRGIFRNVNSLVEVVQTKDEYYAQESRRYVDDAWDGSFLKFLAAFVSGRKLTDKQADEIKRLIDDYREGGGND